MLSGGLIDQSPRATLAVRRREAALQPSASACDVEVCVCVLAAPHPQPDHRRHRLGTRDRASSLLLRATARRLSCCPSLSICVLYWPGSVLPLCRLYILLTCFFTHSFCTIHSAS